MDPEREPQHCANPYEAGSELSRIWQLGYDECTSDSGRTYDDHPASERSVAYDEGRTAGEIDAGIGPQ